MPRRTQNTANLTGARLELKGITKRYGSVHAVREVDLAIESGEFVSLLGPSGSGKTTTLMMIAGFVAPNSGQILLNGADIASMPPEQRNIGVVFQNYALFPHMTVFENVAFPLKMRRLAKEQIVQSVHETLALVQLEGFAQRYPKQLSGGQQQRVALARALVFRPPVLLMDEPLGALDKKLREGLQIEIKHIQSRLGLTVVYVTHDQSEALTMSDRVAVMDGGSILQLGPPDELYQHPANAFVANFLGESNFLAGALVAVGAERDAVETASAMRFLVPHREEAAVGDGVEYAIRPERIRLATGTETLDNRYAATVVERIYLGELTRFRVRLASGEVLSVSEQNRQHAGVVPLAGDVHAGWNAGDAVIVGHCPAQRALAM